LKAKNLFLSWKGSFARGARDVLWGGRFITVALEIAYFWTPVFLMEVGQEEVRRLLHC